MWAYVADGLAHGAVFSVFVTALVCASLRQNPRIWAHSAPPALRAAIGPVDARTRRQRRAWGAVLFVGLAAVVARLAWRVAARGGDFVAASVAEVTCLETFNLYDAAVLDVALVVFKPSWAFPPGTADHPSLRDPRWHLTNFFKGAALALPLGVAVAAVARGLATISR